jgi:hypothetical protein
MVRQRVGVAFNNGAHIALYTQSTSAVLNSQPYFKGYTYVANLLCRFRGRGYGGPPVNHAQQRLQKSPDLNCDSNYLAQL